MVICQGHLDSVVPIERASMAGRTVVQWDKDDCSDMKIIKVDLLGLGMLAVLKDTAYLVPQYYGVPLDYAQLPQDDAVYESIQLADTVGLFQIESRAQMSALPRTRPKCFADLSMQVAIIRPGPVTGKFVNPYIERRLGRQPITYLHPLFEPFLRRTLGVPLFQEQVMKIGMVAANLTGGEAEELRKAMGGKRSQAIIAGMTARLHEGMTANGITPEVQAEIMRVLSTVKEFMFPESHAHSFASIAYSSAYTRLHYVAAYTCGLLNNQPMGFYSPATILNDAKRHGLKGLPIDVQHSEWFCTLEELKETDRDKYTGPFAVRVGFKYVRGLRREIGAAIAESREIDGPFGSEYDLQRRVPSIRRAELTLLAKVAMFRRSGMKISDKGHFQTPLRFSGVFTVEGGVLDALLRSLEPPSHKAWEPERGVDPAKSKQLLRNLSTWVNDKVRELVGGEEMTEIDAEGVSQYLPDDIDDSPIGTPQVLEKISEEPKAQLIMRVRTTPRVSTAPSFDPNEPRPGDSEDDQLEPKNEHNGVEADNPGPMPPIPNGQAIPGGGGGNGAKSIEIKDVRIYCSDPSAGVYRLLFEPTSDNAAYLRIFIIGEVGSEAAPVTWVSVNGAKAITKFPQKGLIGPLTLPPGKRAALDLVLENSLRCALGVSAHAS
jgi:hypothetical protein